MIKKEKKNLTYIGIESHLNKRLCQLPGVFIVFIHLCVAVPVDCLFLQRENARKVHQWSKGYSLCPLAPNWLPIGPPFSRVINQFFTNLPLQVLGLGYSNPRGFILVLVCRPWALTLEDSNLGLLFLLGLLFKPPFPIKLEKEKKKKSTKFSWEAAPLAKVKFLSCK